jgi:hypothetical protein
MDDVVRLRDGGMGWYDSELSLREVIDRELANLAEIRDALSEDPGDEELQGAYQLKRLQLRELVGRRQGEIRARLAQLADEHPELLAD